MIINDIITQQNENDNDNNNNVIRYNSVQWKAAHNSVERRESLFDQLYPSIGNCGAVELDFVVGCLSFLKIYIFFCFIIK